MKAAPQSRIVRELRRLVGERILVPYSLRYTFRSRSQGSIEVKALMDMMGHRSEQMSEHYLRFNPEQFKVYRKYQDVVDRLWSDDARSSE